MNCPMKMEMNTADAVYNWRSVNDGIMGGLSSGGPSFEDGHMIFSGVINTNGGGFSSVRANIRENSLANAMGLKFRVKSDGRAYKVTIRTNARYGWREVSFQAPIAAEKQGEWTDVIVPFSDLKPSVFGRPIRGAEFDPAMINSIGIILADGRDGPFKLGVEYVAACLS